MFKKKKIKSVSFYEKFDKDKLLHIIENEHLYKSKIRKRCFEDGKDPFLMSKHYLIKSGDNDYNKTVYNQCHGRAFGRYFADKSLSMQNMCREIRHSIAGHLYKDVDQVNSHVIILEYLCKQYKFMCPNVTHYINNREKILEELPMRRSEAKSLFLKLINGGYHKLVTKDDFVKKFHNECQILLNNFIKLFPEEYKFQKEKNKKLNKKWINDKGSTLNSLLCEIENNILMIMLEFFKKKFKSHNIKINNWPIVLCFDGLMIGNHPLLNQVNLLEECSKLIFEKIGINIKLKYKEMNLGLKLEIIQENKILPCSTINEPLLSLLNGYFTDKEIKDYFIIKYKHLIHCFDNNIYFFKGHNWTICEDGLIYKLLSGPIYDELHELVVSQYKGNYKMLEEKSKKILILYSENHLSRITKMIKIFIKINDDIWNNKPHLLGFKNGVYDLKNNIFRDGRPKDYISLIVPYNYKVSSEESKLEFMNGFFKQIMPIKEEGLELLIILSTALYGRNIENFIILTGTGRNGKDTLLNLLQSVLGNDLYYYNSVALLCNKRKEGSINQQISNMNKKRAVVYNEPDKDASLRCSVIKELTGNDRINARGIYSKNTIVNLHGTNILMCNEIPELDNIDRAIDNRLIIIPFRSLFQTKTKIEKLDENTENVFEVNTYYKSNEFREKYKLIFLNILIDSFTFFRKNNYKLDIKTKSLLKEKEDYIEECDDFLNWFNENYKQSENEHVKIKDLYTHFKQSDLYNNFTKRSKRKMTRKRLTRTLKNDPNFRGIYFERYQKNDLNLRSVIWGYKNRIERIADYNNTEILALFKE